MVGASKNKQYGIELMLSMHVGVEETRMRERERERVLCSSKTLNTWRGIFRQTQTDTM